MSKEKGFLQIFLFALILIAGLILFIFAKKMLNTKQASPSKPTFSPIIPATTLAPSLHPLPSIAPSLQPASSSASQSASTSPTLNNLLWCKDNTAQTDCGNHGGSV